MKQSKVNVRIKLGEGNTQREYEAKANKRRREMHKITMEYEKECEIKERKARKVYEDIEIFKENFPEYYEALKASKE